MELLETWCIYSLEALIVHIFRFLEIWGIFCKNKNDIEKNIKISKIGDSRLVAHSFLRNSFLPIVFIFKNERVTAIPANPYI